MKYLFKIILIALISFSVPAFVLANEKSGNKDNISGKTDKANKTDKQSKTKKTDKKNSKLDKSLLVRESKNSAREESIKESSIKPNNNEPVNSEIWVQEKENIADYNNVPAANNEHVEAENAPSSGKPFQIIGFILLFLGLIIGIMVWSNYSGSTKKRNNLLEENKMMNLSNFEILDKLDLENGKNIYLIRLLNRKFLIGISWNGISLLSDLSDLDLPMVNNSQAPDQKAFIPNSNNNLDFMTLQNYTYENKVFNNEFDPEISELEKIKKNNESQNPLSSSSLINKASAEIPSIPEQVKSSKTISNRSNKSIIKDPKEEIKSSQINGDFSAQTSLRKSHLSDKSSESMNKFKRPAWLEEREAQKKVIPPASASSSMNSTVNNSQNTTNTIKQAQAEINSIMALVPNKLNDIPEILPEQNQIKERNKPSEIVENQEAKEEMKFERKTTSNIGGISRKISLVEE